MSYYKEIVSHYERCFSEHGPTHKGVDWPNEDNLATRYDVMLGVVQTFENPISILDFGCGYGGLKDHINSFYSSADLTYIGADAGQTFVEHCEDKYSECDFYHIKTHDDVAQLPQCDYVVCNGVWTIKASVPHDEMFAMFSRDIVSLYSVARSGVAFNFMAKHVDWERGDLFHVSLDKLADFLCKNVTRDFVIRNDYGLYEYTVYLRKRNEG